MSARLEASRVWVMRSVMAAVMRLLMIDEDNDDGNDACMLTIASAAAANREVTSRDHA